MIIFFAKNNPSPEFMDLISWGVLGYMIVSLALGLLAARRVHSAEDFMNGGRRLPLLLNVAAFFALWYGSETILGASGAYANEGFQAVVEDPFGAALCLFLVALVFARPLYQRNLLTLGDLYEKSFGPRVGLWASLAMIATFFSYVAGQFVALGVLFTGISGWPLEAGITLCAVVVTLYTMAGGLWSVSFTDLFQGIMIVAGLGLALYFLHQEPALGTPLEVLEKTEDQYFRLWPEATPEAILHFIGAWMVMGLGSIPSQDVFQRFNAARSARMAALSAGLGGALYLCLALVPLYLTLVALKLDLKPNEAPGGAQGILLHLLHTHTPPWVQTLFFGALISAVLSTASGALLAPASLWWENIVPFLSRSGKRSLFTLRIAVLGMAILSYVLALLVHNIFQLVSLASAMGLFMLFVPLCAALFDPKPSPRGALWAMASGTLVYIVFLLLPPLWIPTPMGGFLASVLGYCVGRAIK
ncbi:MAG: sodium:solute symporter family protein [Flavobacteriales bacterium]|nr:sodium:solute symporter family protein [Flavobacteriales bacterium]MCX7768891.1 sodium:solute symporter family protein [Flavobacteriales bacterium]MDW8410017.1 sodium:solute symporter family protein [Flavobacteriales bacterium]